MTKLTINYVSIENLGPFKDKQKFDLSVDSRRPVILLKALNGSGKTTLLTALQVGLYGYKAIGVTRKSEYEQLISGLQRKDALDSSRIEMQLTVEVGSYSQVLDIRREWISKPGNISVREVFKVFVDGVEDSTLADEWDEFINSILPVELVSLFLFDGEKIEALANPERLPALLKRATEVFLGLGGIDALANDLKAVERRAGGKRIDTEDSKEAREQVSQYEVQLQEINEQIVILTQGKAQVRVELDNAQRQLEAFSIEAQRNGLQAYQQAADLNARVGLCKERRQEAGDALARALEDPILPLLWLSPLWGAYKKQWQQDQSSKRARLLVNEFSQRDKRILDMLAEQAPQAQSAVSQLLKDDLKELESAKSHEPVLRVGGDPADISPRILQAKMQLLKMKEEVVKAQLSLDKAQQAVDKIPAQEQISKVFESMSAHTHSVSIAEVKLQELSRSLEEAFTSKNHVENRLNAVYQRIRTELKDGAFQIKMLEAADRAKRTLTIFRERLLASKAQWLSEMITTEFQNLLHKKNLISRVLVEPQSFAVSIEDINGHFLPMERLSAGERQILAIAVLSALIRERKGRFPVVVDTPLARLDRNHRESLIHNFFAKVSHQVLVLSTDEEVEGPVYNALEKHLNREYELLFNDQMRSSLAVMKQRQLELGVASYD